MSKMANVTVRKKLKLRYCSCQPGLLLLFDLDVHCSMTSSSKGNDVNEDEGTDASDKNFLDVRERPAQGFFPRMP